MDDFQRVHLYGSDPEFTQFETWGPNTEEDTRNFLLKMISQADQDPRYEFDFAVCLKDSGLLIGGCGLRRESQKSLVANMGWAINPEFQGQGLATEAAGALLDFGFNQLHLALIYATCDARNVASARVMEKQRMKRVGVLEKDRVVKGQWRTTLRYEICPKPSIRP